MKKLMFLAALLSASIALGVVDPGSFFAGGDGSVSNPYSIVNQAQLEAVNNDLYAHYVLDADIDLSGTVYSEAPIAPSNQFKGSFDGQGYKITGLTISVGSNTADLGLFGVTSDASISNVGVEGVSITATHKNATRIGGLVGYNTRTPIVNCYSTGEITGGTRVGGLLGFNYESDVTDSYSDCNVTASGEYVGGLVAYNHPGGALTNCYATGDVEGEDKVGGLAGENYQGTTTNCFATGDVTGGYQVGGLFGLNQYGDITDCYALGNVYGEDETGGFVGRTQNGIITNCYAEGSITGEDYTAGFAGYFHSGQINDSYAIGAVTSSDNYVGGFVGRNESGAINCCYATGSVEGDDYVGGFAGYTSTTATVVLSFSQGGVTGKSNVAGFTGYNNGATIRNSFTTSNVTADNIGAGFAGTNVSSGSFINCYASAELNVSGSTFGGFLAQSWSGAHIASFWNTDTSGVLTSAGGAQITGITSAQVANEATFTSAGWDFDTIWVMLAGGNAVLQCSNLIVPEVPMLGSGTEDDPYQIQNAAHLEQVNDDLNAYYILVNDIDLASVVYTTAIISPDLDNSSHNYSGTSFKGIFDGNGYTISNITIDTQGETKYFLGLFGFTSRGRVVNVSIDNMTIIADPDSRYIGTISGWNSSSTITGCYSDGQITAGDGAKYIGGLIGQNRHGKILDSSCAVNVTAGNRAQYVGGVCGYNDQWGKLINCYATGAVSGGDQAESIGGFIGRNWFGAVADCYATGAVTGGDDSLYVGGLSGYNSGSLTGCYATGEITSGGDFVGGLSGYSYYGHIQNCYAVADILASQSFAGGLVGTNYKGVIQHCYAAGAVNGVDNLGGLVGTEDDGMTGGSFWDQQTTGLTQSAGGTGKLTAQMKDIATYNYSQWDFDNYWQLPADSYPVLVYPNMPIPNSPDKFSGGAGTLGNPYKINNTDDWQELMNDSQAWDKYFLLTADINLQSIPLTPIGNSSVAFTGSFDGNGYKLSNIQMLDMSDNLGLFGVADGAVFYSMTLENVAISGLNNVGALVGNASGTTIIDATVSGGNVAGDSAVGILVGLNDNYSIITDSIASAVVYAEGQYVGALVGRNILSSISLSYSTGTVAGTANYAGGFVGSNEQGVIENSYSTADVTGSENVGGFAGSSSQATITDCYSIGDVSAAGSATLVGGFLGSVNSSTITGCYWGIETSGQLTSADGFALNTAQMQDRETFIISGWDLDNVWWVPTADYPKIQTEMKGTGTYAKPYQVENQSHLEKINNNLNASYVLMADVDISSIVYPTAIIAADSNSLTTEFEGTSFRGLFDGNGYTITGLNIDTEGQTSHFVGLFGRVDGGVVRNLAVENVNINVGNDSRYIGAIAGWNNSNNMKNCYAQGQITVGDYAESIGGLVGENRGTISTSLADVEITSGAGAKFIGGLVGWNGLVGGGGQKPGAISDCYATGTINGTVGAYANPWAYGGTGGLVGANWYGIISDSYANLTITAANNIGGLLGYTNQGQVENSFWDEQATAIADSAAGTALTTNQMLDSQVFIDAGWDFDTIWTQLAGENPSLVFESTLTSQGSIPANASDVEAVMFVVNNWLSPVGDTTIDINQQSGDDLVDVRAFSALADKISSGE